MHPPNRYFCVFLLSGLLIACGFVSRAEGEEYRVLKNASGKEIRAKILSVASGKVGIQLENGQQFEIPLATLSPADQEFLSNWAPAPGTPGPATATAPLPTEGGVTVAKINEAIGQDLFSTVSLGAAIRLRLRGGSIGQGNQKLRLEKVIERIRRTTIASSGTPLLRSALWRK